MPKGSGVLTVEYKVNFVAAAKGDRLVAEGRVIKTGRTLVITRADVWVYNGEEKKLCAVMQQTLISLPNAEE